MWPGAGGMTLKQISRNKEPVCDFCFCKTIVITLYMILVGSHLADSECGLIPHNCG